MSPSRTKFVLSWSTFRELPSLKAKISLITSTWTWKITKVIDFPVMLSEVLGVDRFYDVLKWVCNRTGSLQIDLIKIVLFSFNNKFWGLS